MLDRAPLGLLGGVCTSDRRGTVEGMTRRPRPDKALSPEARAAIRDAGFSAAAYARLHWSDGEWRGDRCGCTDDRCAGFHHGNTYDYCRCLEVELDSASKV